MRARTKGSKKMDSAAQTNKRIRPKEAREDFENWILYRVWFHIQDRFFLGFARRNYNQRLTLLL